MFSGTPNSAGQSPDPFGARSGYRRIAALALIATTLLLGACGGGGDDGGGGLSANVNIGVTVDGQPADGFVIAPGGSVDLAIRVGDSVILDAVEPVFWTLLVGGAAVSTGVEVFYEGAFIKATALDSFAVAVDTFANFPLRSPIPITLVATSTFDSAQVATVNILITN